jgi:hypothetical protein
MAYPVDKRRAAVPGRSCLDGEADGRERDRDSRGPARRCGRTVHTVYQGNKILYPKHTGRGRVRPVARSKAEMASSQVVRLSSGAHVLPEASRRAQRTRPSKRREQASRTQ